MQTGTRISAIGHGVLIALAVFGLPWFGPREREPIRVTDVSFIREAEFEAAQSAAPAEAPRAEDAPAELPAAPPAEPEPQPEPVAEAPDAPAPEVASLEPPAAIEAPEAPDRIVPKVVTVAPPTAAAPPRPRPAPRVEPEPTPPVEEVQPADMPRPATAPAPEPEVARVEEEPAAPPEAAPVPEQAEPTPPATLALETSGRPKPRRGNQAPRRDTAAEAVLAALQRRPAPTPEATPATPPTPPSVTEPTAAQATSLPVGPPLSNSEKDGLKLAVSKCWNMPAGLRDAQELKITLAAELTPDGRVINASIRLIEPNPVPDDRFQRAFDVGRRALLRCSPYANLPREKYAHWRNVEIVFNPERILSW